MNSQRFNSITALALILTGHLLNTARNRGVKPKVPQGPARGTGTASAPAAEDTRDW